MDAATISAAATLRRIVVDCRSDIGSQRVAVLATGDPSSIHDIRVALRRLRAAIGLFRPVIADQREMQFIDSEARRLAHAVGPARDLQVSARDRTRCPIANRTDRGKAFQAKGGQCPSDAVLHRLRIASKKLRYAVGFLGSAFRPDAVTAYSETAVELQDALGSMNDRAVSGEVLADLAQERRSSRKVKKSCDRLAVRLVHPSKGQRKRLKRAWKAFKNSKPFWR